ncbi:hypothetical protein HZC53_04760 [Candidatus Uhrbacteria bacterium]|nr:hypothetical protein [Candidatus Uhrbacteria bacterium]
MENKSPKQKKLVRRIKAGSTPIPQGPTGGLSAEAENTCGHMGCGGGKCNVRYVGPVTPVRDHHIVHAARHASHIWSAAIVSGLAVVLTGAIGYAAFGAEATNPGGTMYGEFQQINQRLDKIENMLSTLLDRGQTPKPGTGASEMPAAAPDANQCMEKCKKEFGDNIDGVNSCYKVRCSQPAQPTEMTDAQCKDKCAEKYSSLDITQEQKDSYTKACVERSCTTASAPTTTQEDTKASCLSKCTNTRLSCAKEAGSNVTALRSCFSKEAECKSVCNK